MGQTFLYNSGKAEVEKKNLEVTFGVFIDGTLNNKANTKLRFKVKGIADPLREQGESAATTAAERKAYHDATDTYAIADWARRQIDIGGYGSDTSYENDYTNVARLWFCTQEKYQAYIEGWEPTILKKMSQMVMLLVQALRALGPKYVRL